MKHIDKLINWILENAHCIHTGVTEDGIETIYRMNDGTEYRIMLDNDYNVASVNVA